jgi:hypothetical protein
MGNDCTAHMNRFLAFLLVLISTAVLAAPAATAGPITKQNGGNAVALNATSICTIPFYVNYGLCGGNPQAFTNVSLQLNAVQPKAGVWNLELAFSGLAPAATYRLYGNQSSTPAVPGDIPPFFAMTSGTSDADGKLKLKYQTTNPANLSFDLNYFAGPPGFAGGPDYTVVTTYWSNQKLQVKSDGTLFVP